MQTVNIQHVQVTIASTQSSGTATLDGTGTLGKMVVFGTWTLPAVASITADKAFVDLVVTDVDTLTASRIGSASGEVITVEAYVIEFGTDTNVYKGTFSMTGPDTGPQTATWNVNGGSTMTENDLTMAYCWLYYTHDSTSGSNDWQPSSSALRHRFDSTTQIAATRSQSVGAISGHWYAVESTTLSVQHGSWAYSEANVLTHDATITEVTLANSFIMGSYQTNDSLWHSTGNWASHLPGTTTARLERHEAWTDGREGNFQVVEDSALTVQRGIFTYTGTGAFATLTSVDLDVAVPLSGGVPGYPGRPGEDSSAGHADEYSHRMWLSSATALDVAATTAGTNRIVPWEVVEFDKEAGGATPRRVMVIT